MEVKGHENIVVNVPPKASEYALCYVIYNDENADKREAFIQEAAQRGLEAEHVKHCLVIARNMDQKKQAYNFIWLME